MYPIFFKKILYGSYLFLAAGGLSLCLSSCAGITDFLRRNAPPPETPPYSIAETAGTQKDPAVVTERMTTRFSMALVRSGLAGSRIRPVTVKKGNMETELAEKVLQNLAASGLLIFSDRGLEVSSEIRNSVWTLSLLKNKKVTVSANVSLN